MLVYDEKVPWHFWRIAIITGVLPSRDSEIRVAVVRIAKSNIILKLPANKPLPIKNTYQDTSQTDETREQKLSQEAA